MRAEIRQELLILLERRVKQSLTALMSPDQLTQVDQNLDRILAEQIDELLEQAAAEASASKNCKNQSFYGQRLCHCLTKGLNP